MNALAIIALLLVIASGLSYVIQNRENLSMKSLFSPGLILGVAVLLLAINFVSENYDPAIDYATQGWPLKRNKTGPSSKCNYYKTSELLPSCINTQKPSACPGECTDSSSSLFSSSGSCKKTCKRNSDCPHPMMCSFRTPNHVEGCCLGPGN